MKQPLSFTRSALWSAAALALCCTLTSCGGGGDDGGSGGFGVGVGGGGGVGVAGETPVKVNPVYTIPPMLTKSASAKAQPVARPALPFDAPVAQIALPPLVETKAALETPQTGQPLHIGTERTLGTQAGAGEVARLLQWLPLPGGGQAAALRFASSGAAGVRLAVDVQSLPAGAVLRLYGDDGEVQEVPAAEATRLRAINEKAGLTGEAARTVWSLPFDGERATLEVELPAGADTGALALAVPKLSHQMLTLQQAITKGIGDSGSCNLNASCVLDDINAESRAVAKMVFQRDGKGYACTGTLLNGASSNGTPYFITANHCIDSQADASTLVTYWFYRAASCGDSTSADSGMTTLDGGATLPQLNGIYATSSDYDITLLKLNNTPPAGAVYAGSYFGNLGMGDGVLGVHHPSGDLQKYSVGAITGYATCTSSGKGNSGSCTLDDNSARPLYRIG
ncbi:MAG: hypothetical protein IJR28_04245, partial [Ottowia sp.]|nr:hypothetical protein [Ottowia sp.]